MPAMEVAESERSDFEELESQAQAVNDEEVFVSIDELQNHGIGAADIQKLRAAGICTVKVCVITGNRVTASLGNQHDLQAMPWQGQRSFRSQG